MTREIEDTGKAVDVGRRYETLSCWDNNMPSLSQLLSPQDSRDFGWAEDLREIFEWAAKGAELVHFGEVECESIYETNNAMEIVDALVRRAVEHYGYEDGTEDASEPVSVSSPIVER